MDQYFNRIHHILENTELPSRIRFMLQDILELRKNKVDLDFVILNPFLALPLLHKFTKIFYYTIYKIYQYFVL